MQQQRRRMKEFDSERDEVRNKGSERKGRRKGRRGDKLENRTARKAKM